MLPMAVDFVATPHVVPGMEPSLADNYRQKAHKARQRMERAADPLVRSMWRAIAEQHEYLAEHVQQREESPTVTSRLTPDAAADTRSGS